MGKKHANVVKKLAKYNRLAEVHTFVIIAKFRRLNGK